MRASLLSSGAAMLLAAAGSPGASPPDLRGVRNWNRAEQITMPAWLAQFVVGITPEGPITRFMLT